MKKKKRLTSTSSKKKSADTRDEYTVVLEDLSSQFQVFGEGLLGLNNKVDSLDNKVDRLDEKVNSLDKKVNRLDDKVDKIDTRLGKLEVKVDSHTEMIGQVMMDVSEIKHDMKQKVDIKEFARLESRVVRLERRSLSK